MPNQAWAVEIDVYMENACFLSKVRFSFRTILFVAVSVLSSGQLQAQINYTAGSPRRVSLELHATGPTEGFAEPSQVSSSPFTSFFGVANDTVSRSYLNEAGGAVNCRASGNIRQDSLLSPNYIFTTSSATFSAEFSGADYPTGGGARVQGFSEESVFFNLYEYCRFTMSGSITTSGSSVAEPSGNAGTSANLIVTLGNSILGKSFAYANGEISTGYGHESDSVSASVTTNGFLPAGVGYVFGGTSFLNAGVGPYGNGSAQGSSLTTATLRVEPMGTRLMGFEVIQTIQDWDNSVALIANKPTYVRAHVEPISAPYVPVMNARLRGYIYGLGGTELPGSPLTPMANSAHTATPNAASDARRLDWQGSVNFQLPPDWTTNSIRLQLEMDGLEHGAAALEQAVSFTPSPRLELRVLKIRVMNGTNVINAAPSSGAVLQEVARIAEL
jgi:hypothetical protein